VPGYTHVARRSEKGGDVRAVVGVGKSGKAGNIETVAADPNLAEEVLNYLTYATTYDEACVGKKVEILFTFRLEGEAEWTPPVKVRFQPPNHFVIRSRPRRPNIN
jgi:hypothetical protein